MNNFLLFVACVIAYIFIEIFLFKLFSEWLPRLWNWLFGTHTVLICDLKYNTTEIRRNFDNKTISRRSYPNYSFLLFEGIKQLQNKGINNDKDGN